MFDSIHQQLTELRRMDRHHEVFGSKTHYYRSQAVALQDVVSFERSIGIRLPPDYRDFLIHIGYGAGPYYGIWSPQKSLEEIRYFYQGALEIRGPLVDVYPLASAVGFFVQRITATTNWPCVGCIPICPMGCEYCAVLAWDGESDGRVWNTDCSGGDCDWVRPAGRPPGIIMGGSSHPPLPSLSTSPTFLEWFNGWLESCLADLSEQA